MSIIYCLPSVDPQDLFNGVTGCFDLAVCTAGAWETAKKKVGIKMTKTIQHFVILCYEPVPDLISSHYISYTKA
uniref:Uncharacterized protein n=1 Tax=Anguilla anguilla TaxID=7936 RepID=A0A0E9WCM7_ANGAN